MVSILSVPVRRPDKGLLYEVERISKRPGTDLEGVQAQLVTIAKTLLELAAQYDDVTNAIETIAQSSQSRGEGMVPGEISGQTFSKVDETPSPRLSHGL
jgi:hypothetical protein